MKVKWKWNGALKAQKFTSLKMPTGYISHATVEGDLHILREQLSQILAQVDFTYFT